MAELSHEQLQEFADGVAQLCEQMQLSETQMLEAIGSTLMGAAVSFGTQSLKTEVPGVATVLVETFRQTAEN
ncbi:MAG: hypothetical protein C9356_14925 [Oleiphilus sp.]|nr:MAG: hypothetical protein C9356_14925 [Oleiphilus sp.]